MQGAMSIRVTLVHMTACVMLSEPICYSVPVFSVVKYRMTLSFSCNHSLKYVIIISTVFFLMQNLNKALQSIMGKSNLRFAGMSIAVNISIDGLGLLIPTTRQVR